MRRGDRVEIASEVQVHIFHRHDLRVAAPGCATLHAEIRPQRGFANTDHRLLADAVQTIAKTNGGGGLAFARRRRIDGGHQDQLAILTVLHELMKAWLTLALSWP